MRRRSVSTVSLCVALLALAALSCRRADEDAAEPAPEGTSVSASSPRAQVDPALVGTEWLLTSLDGEELPPKTEITLEIGKEEAGGSSGCHSYGGDVEKMADGSVEWSGANDMTTVGCAGDVGRQETKYLNLLDEIEAYRIEDGWLDLMDGEGETRLVFEEKAPLAFDPSTLTGTRWAVRSVDGEEPVEGSVPTIEFGQGREATWYDGCEVGSGRYTVTDYGLVFKQEGIVEGECMKPERLVNPEEPCVQVCFYPSGNYRLRAGLLEVRSDTGDKTAILEPLPEGVRLERDGTPWELRYFVENGEKTPVAGEAPITVTFDHGTLRRAGVIFGSTGCNEYRAAYEYPAAHNTFERIVVDDPVNTRQACPKSQRLAAQERRFLAVVGDLGEHPSASMLGQLTLETRDGRELIFSAPE